ncbi:aldo/keto reductase [Methylocapsa acidiphila]|uniref:aldo/keto reductase n=1 Tax=Methylocapsa acidiphila TaxID=133552 RepID=UPI0003FEEAF8|nr:aldo/keto reductase [Methylocapsa acidiphila]
MRTVECPGLGRKVSTLGFGCASLGSRVSEAQGRRALAAAFERGVDWFDVAPEYGDGEAEAILGRFLIGRRDRVVLSLKIGRRLVSISPAARLLRPLARRLARLFPEFLGEFPLTRTASLRPPLEADEIEASLAESLARLRTDHVDVLVLDDPSPEDCVSDAMQKALRRILDKGYARAVAISGAPEAIVAGAAASDLFQIAQFRDSPFEQAADRLRAAIAGGARPTFVTHGIFGGGVFDRVLRLLGSDGGRLAALASQLGYGPPYLVNELLLDYAFANNPDGVVLASMSNLTHIELNCARASNPPRDDVAPFVVKYIVEGRS